MKKISNKKIIKIFLASSITELEGDRKDIGDFFNQLNNIYIYRDIYFQLVKCDMYDDAIVMGGKQAQYDQEIRDSELCFVLFFKKIGEHTVHEFEVALDSFKNCKKPRIVVYFKNAEDGEETAEVKAYKEKLDKELQHYYNSYNNIDTLKLGIIMQIQNMGLDREQPVIKDGKVMFGGEVIANAENIPLFEGNKRLSELKEKLKEIHPKYIRAKKKADDMPNDIRLASECRARAGEIEELENQIERLEIAILEAAKTMFEEASEGGLSLRQIDAYHAFEKGDLVAALEVLDRDKIMADLGRDEQMADGYVGRMQTKVNELLFRIAILMIRGVTEASAKEIDETYKTICSYIKNHNLNKDPLYTYAVFLHSQKKYEEAVKIAKQLAYYYADPSAQTDEYKVARLDNLLGTLYYEMYRSYPAADRVGAAKLATDAEAALKKARDSLEKTAGNDPHAFELELAAVYNNLGLLFQETDRYQMAENVFKKALKIIDGAQGQDPREVEFRRAIIYNDLGFLYTTLYKNATLDKNALRKNATDPADAARAKDAEAALKRSREILERLALRHSNAYGQDLARCLFNLGDLYAAMYINEGGLVESYLAKALEDAYKNAISIIEDAAQKNPDAYEDLLEKCCFDMGCHFLLQYQNTHSNDMCKQAEHFLGRSIDILKRMAQKNPDAYESPLAMHYFTLAGLYEEIGRYKQATDAYNMAYAVAKKHPSDPDCALIIAIFEKR